MPPTAGRLRSLRCGNHVEPPRAPPQSSRVPARRTALTAVYPAGSVDHTDKADKNAGPKNALAVGHAAE